MTREEWSADIRDRVAEECHGLDCCTSESGGRVFFGPPCNIGRDCVAVRKARLDRRPPKVQRGDGEP